MASTVGPISGVGRGVAGSRESAIRKAYSHRTGEHQVWLFAGPNDDVYSKAPEPLP